ncbi:MAG: glycosyltransferase family 4 protein [Sulfuricaulis sp.]|uniref:glycosyltransferase family 4 protein n=1 Tax=Sulfuricaulis sp. TaxID=2003553 RepID=UPI0025CD9027|nr:glycosyltransferase family 4 protein [Sulfuricaulis sp.]MCR4347745.1 glycosyltransferase family 4 protein [Sulfuricaulis sp.]
MKCRIIYLHRLEFTGSGQTIQVLRDYDSLARLGYEVHVFYRAPRALSDAELAEAASRHGLTAETPLKFHCISEGFGGKRRLFRAADSLMEKSDLPVVIAVRTMDHARLALALRRRTHRQPVRVIIELHEGAFPHMVYRERGRRVRAWFSRRSERHVLREVDGIVATVGSQETLLKEIFPAHARVAVLPNGVDLPAFENASSATTAGDGRFHLRYAGQFLAWKNTDIMIEAIKYLPSSVILELAGGKPGAEEQTRHAIEVVARRHGVERRAHYVGFLSPKDVPAFLMQANALLLPLGNNVQSRYFTSPMKLFEYAASGVPMVVARQPTTLSLVRDGEEVLMVGPDSAREMADAVSRLMTAPELAARLAARARAWVRQYSYEERARRYHEFLEALSQA